MKRSFSRLQRTRHSWTLPSRTLTSSFSWGPSRISLLDKRTRTVDSPHVRGFTTTGNPQPQRTEVEAWRHPSESYHEKHLLFQTDKVIKDRYIASYGKIRLGKILEDLDQFAGEVAYKHAEGEGSMFDDEHSLTIVTAATDHIVLFNEIQPDRDLRFRGRVTWVGKSSMEVRVEVDSLVMQGYYEPHIVAYVVMVARDKNTGKAAVVPKLKLETEAQKKYFAQGEENARRRKENSTNSLLNHPPRPDEVALIHSFFMKEQGHTGKWRAKNESIQDEGIEYVATHNTRNESTQWTHPQNRNVHSKIHGGFLTRQAFELAFNCGYLFSGTRPVFISMDDNNFIKPVEIGSILSLSSYVVFTAPEEKYLALLEKASGDPLMPTENLPHPLVSIMVQADVIADKKTRVYETTNIFHFTFRCENNTRRILPRTYADAMSYLQARRRTIQNAHMHESMKQVLLQDFGRLRE